MTHTQRDQVHRIENKLDDMESQMVGFVDMLMAVDRYRKSYTFDQAIAATADAFYFSASLTEKNL